MRLGQGRSSHQSCFIKVIVLKNFAIFTENQLCWSLFSTKFIKKVFSYEYCKILKNPFQKIICVRLLLTRDTNNICFLFLEKCLLAKPNFPLFRYLAIFSVSLSLQISLSRYLSIRYLPIFRYLYFLFRGFDNVLKSTFLNFL